MLFLRNNGSGVLKRKHKHRRDAHRNALSRVPFQGKKEAKRGGRLQTERGIKLKKGT